MGTCAGRCPSLAGPAADVVFVQLRNGSIVGEVLDNVKHFGGVPLAAPPVRELRWRRPQPVKPWDSVLDCTEHRPLDARRAYPVQDLSDEDKAQGKCISEDCLYGHVWAPVGAEKAPVLVWFYGGSLVNGCAHDAYCSGRAYAERGIVFCTFNYRLGALGFLCPDGADSNCGFWDQVAVLRWVRDEIVAFGGDPDSVTIMGESSGGDSVFYHCASPASRGLFHRAIIMSPCSFPVTRAQSREVCEEFVRILGAGSLELKTLQNIPPEEILRVQCGKGFRIYPTVFPGWRLGGEPLPPFDPIPDPTPAGLFRFSAPGASWEGSYWPYPAVVLDGEFLVETPLDAMLNGSAAGVSVIVGSNREEISPQSFGPELAGGRREALQRLAWELAGMPAVLHATSSELMAKAEALAEVYEKERLADPWGLGLTADSPSPEQWLCNTALSDFSHISCAEHIARRLAAPGNSKCVYRYQFNGYGGLGAHHGAELQLCLGEEDQLDKGSADARDLWLDSWSAFVTTGDPNTKAMSESWKPYDGTGRTLLLWDGLVGWRAGAATGFDQRAGLWATVQLWEELFQLQRISN